jgi:hypothetical protein
LHGTSFRYTFADAEAKSRHTTQYFAILGNRSIYKDGWLLSARLPKLPWDSTPPTIARFAPGAWDPDKDPVELYHLDDDFSQANNLAAGNPQKVSELTQLFWNEAAKNNVLPLLAEYSFFFNIRPPAADATRFVYRPGVENIPPGVFPPIFGRSYSIVADVNVPETNPEGVIVAEASFLGGFALFVDAGKLKHTCSFYGLRSDTLAADEPLPAGKVTVRFDFVADDPGKRATGGKTVLFVNDKRVAEGRLQYSVAFRFSLFAGMDIGRDNGLPVAPAYAKRSPFPFTGTIDKVEFQLK